MKFLILAGILMVARTGRSRPRHRFERRCWSVPDPQQPSFPSDAKDFAGLPLQMLLGHINADSGLGAWPAGRALLAELAV